MNTKQFIVLFFNVAVLLGVSNALGTFETVTLNGALTVPLLSATAGTLATPLAVLGVLKLGAAALLALTLLGNQEEEEYYEPAGYGYRHKRSVQESGMAMSPEAIFGLASAMDTYGCGKQLICELEARDASALDNDEKLLIAFFSLGKNKVNPASPKAEYDLAANLGLANKNEVLCRARYANCPYTAPEMMDALRNAQF